MSSYIFESIECKNELPVTGFITGIKNSFFHWHYEYELISVLKGSITVRYGSIVSNMKEGDIIMVNSRTIHSIQAQEQNMVMFIQLGKELFSDSRKSSAVFNFYLDSVQNKIPPSCGYNVIISQMAKIIHGIKTQDDDLCKNKISSYRLRAEVYNLLADIMDYVEHDVIFLKGNETESEKLEDTMQCIDYIKDHLADFDVLGDVCTKFNVSRKTLDRNMHSFVNMSSKEMLELLRLEKAKRLLSATNKTPSFIISECGFGSEKTFYRVFKEQTGVTPVEYRNNCKKNVVEEVGNQLKSYLRVEDSESEKMLRKFMDNLTNA